MILIAGGRETPTAILIDREGAFRGVDNNGGAAKGNAVYGAKVINGFYF
jgi:hypothetical protein